ncbi:MAG: SDR family NAD(P)-dependent oxidoreductase [Hyphomicrobiales bacterium]|nr:SDR family NAD(P)-dependent oxidoreductase [Hyphomicrobiales bacterium]
MLLKGKVCIITGAGSERGLGRATAELFAEHGAQIVALDIDLGAARGTAKALKGRGHMAIKADVTRRAECDRAAARTLARFGRIDILVNNAGITSPERLLEVSDALYDRIMDVNMRGSFHMTQAVVPAMRAQKAGSIVNMASVSAQRGGGVFGGTPYAAAKGAILGYTKACARELGPDNVRVNAICPSLIDTDITAGKMSCERRREILAGIPMGRVGSARDVAGCCLFLASDLSAYVTGSEVDVNGGSHIH